MSNTTQSNSTDPNLLGPDTSAEAVLDNGLLERLGDIGDYVSSAPAPLPRDSFTKTSFGSTGGSLSERLAEAARAALVDDQL